jgi:ABC-type polysaccharide/polyol phosphate transport system ATPase subunit
LPSVAADPLPDRERSSASAPPALVVDDVSKTFRLPHQRYSTLKERALHPLRTRTFDELHAVDRVSLEIREGEFFGIVGRNGSGKSTLLKCLAGIYKVDSGRVSVTGRISPFIELGVGLNAEFTARENVLVNAIMLGLSRREARERFDEIIAFAELEDFLDLKLKNYSSGMAVRLAFSVAIQVDADILLVDEVLAVGDVSFQQKCFEQFHRLKAAGKTIIFVTHDMSAVERFCDRAMLMEHGRVVALGEPRPVARAYTELNFERLEAVDGQLVPTNRSTGAVITDVWFESDSGERVTTHKQDTLLRLCMEVLFHERIEEPVFHLQLRNEARQTVLATSTRSHAVPTGTFDAGERATFRASVYDWLTVGRYWVTPAVMNTGGVDVLDARDDEASFVVHGMRRSGSVVEIPHELDLQRG